MRMYKLEDHTQHGAEELGDAGWYSTYVAARRIAKQITSGVCSKKDHATVVSVDITERPSFSMVRNALNGLEPPHRVLKRETWRAQCCGAHYDFDTQETVGGCTEDCDSGLCASAKSVKEQPK